MEYKHYVKNDVSFISGFNIVKDARKIKAWMAKNPTNFNFRDFFRDMTRQRDLPPVIGFCGMGHPTIVFNTCDSLQDLYIKQNSRMTKSFDFSIPFNKILKTSILFD